MCVWGSICMCVYYNLTVIVQRFNLLLLLTFILLYHFKTILLLLLLHLVLDHYKMLKAKSSWAKHSLFIPASWTHNGGDREPLLSLKERLSFYPKREIKLRNCLFLKNLFIFSFSCYHPKFIYSQAHIYLDIHKVLFFILSVYYSMLELNLM